MTVLVGIKCKNGIVIGSDSSATFGSGQISTIEQLTKKIEIVHDRYVIAGTGQVGLGQRFCNVIDSTYSAGTYKGLNGITTATLMAHHALNDFASTCVQKGQYGALVAYPVGNELFLCEFAINDFQPEMKTENGLWYASMGGGQLIADPFLGLMRSVFWESGAPSLSDGIFIATWTLKHTIDINAGGVGGPIQMATLTLENGHPVAKYLTDDQLQEHLENVDGAIAHLKGYEGLSSVSIAGSVPQI